MWLRLAMRSTSALLLSLLLLCSDAHHVSGSEDDIGNQESILKQERPSSSSETSVKIGSGNVSFNGGRNWMMTLGQWIKVRRKSDGGIEVYVVHRPADTSNPPKKIPQKPEQGDENDVEEFRRRRRRQILPILA